MAISFGSAPGNLFNRLGKIGLLCKQAKTYQTSQQTNLIDTTNGAVAQYNGEPDLQALIGNNYINILDNASSVGSFCQGLAAQTINRICFRDNPQLGQTLQNTNTLSSILEVIRQMKIQGASVLAMTIASTPGASFTGTGNSVIVTSTRRPSDGLVQENTFGETLTVTCSADSYTGGATAGNETFLITGQGNQSNFFAFNWPLGSNCSTSASAIDGDVNNGSGNLLTNSGFETWSSNVPGNWTLVTGAAGTNIYQESSLIYDPTSGGSAVRIAGDGSTLTQIRQQFNTSTGTLGALDELTQYSVNIFCRRDGTAAAAGVLTVDLVDNLFNVIKDANGANNSFTIDLTTLSTAYAPFNGVFRTPSVLPSAQYIRLRLSTALTNGRSVYFDKLSMGIMTKTVPSGIYLGIHAGSIPHVRGDYNTIVNTNSRGAAGVLDSFQVLMARLLPEMINNELLLPSSSTPTISDSLIG